MVDMFNRLIDPLIKCLSELNEKMTANTIDTIDLVGGFSESKIVQKALKEHFSGKNGDYN